MPSDDKYKGEAKASAKGCMFIILLLLLQFAIPTQKCRHQIYRFSLPQLHEFDETNTNQNRSRCHDLQIRRSICDTGQLKIYRNVYCIINYWGWILKTAYGRLSKRLLNLPRRMNQKYTQDYLFKYALFWHTRRSELYCLELRQPQIVLSILPLGCKKVV